MSKTLEDLKTLRDEIKVKLHLAGLEAKKEWERLEPKLHSLEKRIDEEGHKVADATNSLLDELTSAFKKLKDRLKD